MGTSFPRIAVCVTKERIHQEGEDVNRGLLKSEATAGLRRHRLRHYCAYVVNNPLLHEVLVEVLHPYRYDACLAREDAEGLHRSQLESRARRLLKKQWQERYEYLEDYRLNAYLLVEGCLAQKGYILNKVRQDVSEARLFD